MTLVELLNLAPSVMSAIAAIAAAYAAFVALRVSKKANSISEKSILAAHHQEAASLLSLSIEKLRKETMGFSSFSFDMWAGWSREIASKDQSCNGGEDPRPLRHVLSNGSEMLAMHASKKCKQIRGARHSMFSIIRCGVQGLNEREFNKFLKKADYSYHDFESTFGFPLLNKNIGEADAFRWVCYQLSKRVKSEDWKEIWCNAWMAEGWLTRYRSEFLKVQSMLQETVDALLVEKRKVEFSVFPIKSSSKLHKQYELVLAGLEFILDACSFESLESYSDWKYVEDIPLLILYSMGVSYLAERILNSIYEAGDMSG